MVAFVGPDYIRSCATICRRDVMSPYKSAKQRRYMHAKFPEIAKKWDKKYGTKVRKTTKKTRKK